MMVLVLAATKGGVGKTTLAASLAVEALRKRYRVGLVDIDPQQSLARWHELRNENKDGELMDIWLSTKGMKRPEQAINDALHQDLDVLIIDTPPGGIVRTELAVEVADLVLIPVRASPIDVESMDAIVELINEHEREFVFVLNATKTNSVMAKGARKYLMQHGPVLTMEVADRVNYAGAFLQGLVAAETSPKASPAAAESAALWVQVKKRLTHKAKTKHKV